MLIVRRAYVRSLLSLMIHHLVVELISHLKFYIVPDFWDEINLIAMSHTMVRKSLKSTYTYGQVR